MSKRTRKPFLDLQDAAATNNLTTNTITSRARSDIDGEKSARRGKGDDDIEADQVEVEDVSNGDQRKSLKQLINYRANDDDDEQEGKSKGGSGSGRSSLGQHFTQEQEEMKQQPESDQVHQLQVQVVKKHHSRKDGVRGMMSRYAKVLSHLVKAKREPCIATASRKSHLLRLKM
ncbi:hypothetical protein CCACVL1_11483 [Corchorus capsularis]|uniref:Uncharacterized protein n=1 Tax=Corchorus capsularis TaxID=210143 RepID=A0A1R3IKX5_COCAP|nr:hypothetical protein CCACVL1_11483 [Corchorus capsularis]